MTNKNYNQANSELLRQISAAAAASITDNVIYFTGLPTINTSACCRPPCGETIAFNEQQALSLLKHYPDAYFLIVQQHQKLFQQSAELNEAKKHVALLQEEIKSLKLSASLTGADKELDDKKITEDAVDVDGEVKCIQLPPPVDEVKKSGTTSPSSQLTDVASTEDSLHNKKRALENNHFMTNQSPRLKPCRHPTDSFHNRNFELQSKNYFNTINQYHRGNQYIVPNMAPTSSQFSAEKHHKLQKNEKSSSPDLATVARSLAAAVSPHFK